MTNQVKKNSNDRYNDTFPTILRELMEKTGITQKDLAEVIDVRPQTLSLYRNGQSQPLPDKLVLIARHFGVSVDYLLTGISSDNMDVSKELGLSETSIEMLKRSNSTENFDGMPTVSDYINNLLSDGEFYQFIEDLIFKVNGVQCATNMTPEVKQKLPQFNYEGYYIWELQMFIQKFIKNQLVKNGLEIEKE